MEANKISKAAIIAGKIILENGGETYRVEETIEKICTALGAINSDSFVTPTGIMLSVTDENGNIISTVKRINSRGVNLTKIAQVNELSRNIKMRQLSVEDVIRELGVIEQSRGYGRRTLILTSAMTAGFFTLLFGGNFSDFLVSLFIGSIIKWVSLMFSKIKVNDFFINIVGGAIAATIALTAVHLNIAQNVDKIIIGSIMLLVPGLAITNAVRDIIHGDLVSGISRGLEAFFIAVGIAAGTGIILKLWLVYFGGTSI
ncbi:MAG: threonine/serine exporter family protein [Bacillota bacterium]|nr:threonine/serine exporter family protein [Bacillota bacterium]